MTTVNLKRVVQAMLKIFKTGFKIVNKAYDVFPVSCDLGRISDSP